MKTFFSLLFALLGFGNDVVTVTTGTAGNAGSIAAELINFMSAQMLDVAELNTVLDQFADKRPLPSNASKTIQFTRLEKLAVASTPTQLVEGVAPDANGMTINQFTATVEQYGNLYRISELAELTARHPLIQEGMKRLATWAAETYDQLVFNVLNAASNTYFVNNRGADTSLFASDRVAYVDLVELMATLQDNGGKPFDGGNYVFVCPPQVHAGLLQDPDWKASHQFMPDPIYRGEVGTLANFRVVNSNSPAFAATSQSTSGQTNKVFSSFALAKSAYQLTDLQSIEAIPTPPGGQGDPLKQSFKLGIKFSQKSVITNQTWIRRVRSSGLNSINN